jgi:exoribonuclease R
MNFQIMIENRDYSSWNITSNNEKNEKIEINPINEKLFSKDIFSFSDDKITLIESPIRMKKEIPGILILEDNKTFGRTSNKKRLYYKCIPHDKQLPVFLVPYEIQLGFSKVQKNRYVTFRYESWEDKHPHGVLVQNLGTFDQLDVFYEYQLYCKDLHVSITPLIKKTRELIENIPESELTPKIIENPNFFIEDRRKTHHVFSIDPEGCVDIDDAMSIKYIEKQDETLYEISIYIANVVLWLETFQLWDYLTDRISTIYMPDKRRPMMPILLSENLCSLQKGKDRFAFTMVVLADLQGTIKDIQIKNTLITVAHNYAYEEPELFLNKDYNKLLEITKKMDPTLRDSHDFVSFWMIFMNSQCGNRMRENKKGIFRSSKVIRPMDKDKENIREYNQETARFLKMWNNVSGEYILYHDDVDDESNRLRHDCLGVDTYVHITSPIRRLVDTINQCILMKDLILVKKISKEGEQFIEKWFSQIEKLNTIMKSIRKVQSDCDLVYRCFQQPDIMGKEYTGVILEKMCLENGMFSYTVYLEDLKMVSRTLTKWDILEYSIKMFRIFLFEDEDKIQKKIRLQIVDSFSRNNK